MEEVARIFSYLIVYLKKKTDENFTKMLHTVIIIVIIVVIIIQLT